MCLWSCPVTGGAEAGRFVRIVNRNTDYTLTKEEPARVEKEVERVTESITMHIHESVNKTEEN